MEKYWTEMLCMSIITALAGADMVRLLPGEKYHESISIRKKTLRQVQDCKAQGQSICNL
jgi:hypothetical protein